jgi:hypothetical protein
MRVAVLFEIAAVLVFELFEAAPSAAIVVVVVTPVVGPVRAEAARKGPVAMARADVNFDVPAAIVVSPVMPRAPMTVIGLQWDAQQQS